MKRLLPLIVAALAMVGQGFATSITLSDGSFATWTASAYGGFPMQSMSNPGSGGNPGEYLQVVTPGSAIFYTQMSGAGLSYNPSAGGINTLDWSIDLNEFSTFGQGMFYGLLAIQNGTAYLGPGNITQGIGNQWTTRSVTGIGAMSFFDTIGNHPDFSVNGGLITFGLLTANQGGSGITVGFDNFRVDLNVASSVPEGGASIVLLALALMFLFTVARRLAISAPRARSARVAFAIPPCSAR